jgi:hypothetical protein
MPKKTKREKIIAQLRRQLHESGNPQVAKTILPNLNQNVPNDTKPVSTPIYNIGVINKTNKQTINTTKNLEISDLEFKAIKHDLIKTIIIVICAIGAEFLLYIKFGA